jgi:hypothetical protein
MDWSALHFRRGEHINTMKRDAARAATEQGREVVAKRKEGLIDRTLALDQQSTNVDDGSPLRPS